MKQGVNGAIQFVQEGTNHLIDENTRLVQDALKVPIQAIKIPTFQEFVRELGYPLEKHVYKTKDGCLNTVFRIPGKKGTKAASTGDAQQKPVVIYQHGLTDSCAGIICDEEKSIGLRLVEEGYDLWLNNSRCNKFSQDHQLIDLNNCTKEEKESYYNISFDEMAEFDQPALWEYVMRETGAEEITYIGHSQGTTQMFVSMQMYPEFYKKHMKKFVAIAPCVRVENMNS